MHYKQVPLAPAFPYKEGQRYIKVVWLGLALLHATTLVAQGLVRLGCRGCSKAG